MRKYLGLILLVCAKPLYAQKDSVSPALSLEGYLEVYYGYDINKPAENKRPDFIYSHNRHNEFNLNLGFLRASVEEVNMRGSVAIMLGTYTNANMSAEPGVLKNVLEANVGVRILRKKQIWLDAGIFSSHIGFESAIGKDCWNLTRSILADNSPYYESGIKISHASADQKWFMAGLILNGWQRIQRQSGNSTPAFGHQVTYKCSKFTLNSSSFIGSDFPDSIRRIRYFHNFYGQFLLYEKLGLTAGIDFGAQQKSKQSRTYFTWYSVILIAKYTPTEKLSISVRSEYYSDKHHVIISTGTPNGFRTFGYSINFDYAISENAVWRTEARSFVSKDGIFIAEGRRVPTNHFFTTSLAISF